MKIQSITEEEFNSYNFEKNPMSSLFGTEKKWFEDNENNLIATIIKDKIDSDWAYVIMALDSDGEYRAMYVEASMESEEIAESRMNLKLS
jgi:hypothetical protein